MTGVGLYGGLPGWLVSGSYFLLDIHMSAYENKLRTNPQFLDKEFQKATNPIIIGPKFEP